MKHKIKITLPTLPYDHDVREIIGYLQTVISELTGTNAQVHIDDYDFSSAIGAFKENRKPSHPKRILEDR